jgi:hypothetical protein
MNPLTESLHDCAPLLPASFREGHARLFDEEHLERLGRRLLTFARDGVPSEPPPPHFAAECTPPAAEAWAFFRDAVTAWEAADDKGHPSVLQPLADAFVAAGCRNVLLLLGQRLTPASLTDARAIPPTRAELTATANALHNPADGLTVAARALTKHVHRSPEAFWGEVRGSSGEKNAAAARLLARILDGGTWWNVFGHYQHDVVYEVRLPSGHGARWSHGGREFIGFLEPFAEEKCPTLGKPPV